ncbi:hypothetical protein V2A60_008772 [Cordyceps javanica]
MEGNTSPFAITLSIFFFQDTCGKTGSPEVLLALPTGTRSTIAAEDMWDSFGRLGVDVAQLQSRVKHCTDNITAVHDTTHLHGADCSERLRAVEDEQLAVIKSRLTELQTLQEEYIALDCKIKALRGQKEQLEDDILRLQRQDSIWGVRDPDREQEVLFSEDLEASVGDEADSELDHDIE